MAKEPNQELAGRLRNAREQAGLSQGQVAKKLRMHRPTVSEIEAGRRHVSADELATFASEYGISIDWLLGKIDEDGDISPRLRLAARELGKLDQDDFARVIRFLETLRDADDHNR